MKRILLLSDTHAYLDDAMLKYIAEADQIWHAGDIGNELVHEKITVLKPLKAVYGNIDDANCRKIFPETIYFEEEGVSVLMIHIAGPFGKYNPKVNALIHTHKPKLLVCGHSHILKVAYDKKNELLYVNPGAAGKHGFHKIRTLLRFILEKGEIKNLEVIELGNRSSL